VRWFRCSIRPSARRISTSWRAFDSVFEMCLLWRKRLAEETENCFAMFRNGAPSSSRRSISFHDEGEGTRCRFGAWRGSCVLVQLKMEKGRSPLVTIPTFGWGFFKATIRPPSYHSAWLRPRRARSVSPGKIIVAPPPPICLNFRLARHTSTIGGKLKLEYPTSHNRPIAAQPTKRTPHLRPRPSTRD